MKKETRFADHTIGFKKAKNKVEFLPPNDLGTFRIYGFNLLAASILDFFEIAPDLKVVRITHNLTHTTVDGPNSYIQCYHELYVYAKEAGIDPELDINTHVSFVRNIIPFEVMGNGEFEISRDSLIVQQFLALREYDVIEWHGITANVSTRLNASFGSIQTVHSLI
jgi:hypothetical protein